MDPTKKINKVQANGHDQLLGALGLLGLQDTAQMRTSQIQPVEEGEVKVMENQNRQLFWQVADP